MDFLYYLKTLPEFKGELNESAVKILEVLIKNEKPMSTKELEESCNISSRMIQYNLERLLNSQPPLIKRTPDFKDLRKKRYTLAPDLHEKVSQIKNRADFSNNKFNM